MTLPKISVVIPTLTSPDSLERVLISLGAQSFKPVEVVVVAQREPEKAAVIIERSYPSARLVTSEIGLSRARNVGIRSLKSNWDIVALPDDDIEYAGDAFRNAANCFDSDLGALCGRVSPENPDEGARISFGDTVLTVTKQNVWTTTIEAGFFLSREVIEVAGYYDENLGLGSSSPWKSGEGTELLLRALRHRFRIEYRPEVSMIEVSDQAKIESHGVTRLRNYARGTGRVYRMHYGYRGCLNLLIRSVGRLAIYGVAKRGSTTRSDWAVLSGRTEGILGLPRRSV